MLLLADRRWGPALVGSLCLLLVGVGFGRLVVETQAVPAGTLFLLVGAAGALAAVTAMFLGPVACLAGVVALMTVPLIPGVPIVESVDVTAADAFYVPLVVWAGLELMKPRPPGTPKSALPPAPILLFLAVAGFSVLYVVVVDIGALEYSLVAWLRLVQTVSLAFLAALFLRSTRDVKIVLLAVAIAGLVAVVIGVLGGGPGAEGEGRATGVAGPNQLGLISGLLLLMAALAPLGSQLIYRLPFAVVGVAGLVEAQSVGSIVGTSVAVTLGLVLAKPKPPGVPSLRALKAVTALVLALGLAYAAATVVRPENLPTSPGFKTSSAWHRTVVGAGGVELAVRNPIFGVGWRRSSLPHVIGDPDLTSELRARFFGTKDNFFPDVTPTSVHNAYIQIAAEMGLLGVGVLILVLVSLARGIRGVLRQVPPGTTARRQLWYLSWAVVLILVWLNDNPLYGGQAETVLLAVLVGAIAGLGASARSPSAS